MTIDPNQPAPAHDGNPLQQPPLESVSDRLSPTRSSEPPRLSIVHLFVWIAASAVCLAAVQNFETTSGLREKQPTAAVTLLRACYAPFSGAAFAGLLLFIDRWRRGLGFAREPGEWLMCVYGVFIALWTGFYGLAGLVAVAWPASEVPQRANQWAGMRLMYYWSIGVGVLEGVLFAAASRRLRAGPVWRGLFWLLAALYTLRAISAQLTWWPLGYGLSSFYLPTIAAATLITGVTLFDWRVSLDRPWTHWVGVVVGVAAGPLAFIALLVQLYR
ncbi:MAG TPA: hypothetical protein VFI31_03970 [Pirellulales bacterium]|nr:hypothetical protein [Pirellulales bacterium]